MKRQKANRSRPKEKSEQPHNVTQKPLAHPVEKRKKNATKEMHVLKIKTLQQIAPPLSSSFSVFPIVSFLLCFIHLAVSLSLFLT